MVRSVSEFVRIRAYSAEAASPGGVCRKSHDFRYGLCRSRDIANRA